MLLYVTGDGIALAEGSDLLLLDLPHQDVWEVFADAETRADAVDLLRGAGVRKRVGIDEVPVLAPIARPERLVVVGANHADHVREAGLRMPGDPLFMVVPGDGAAGVGDAIRLPAAAPDDVDFEGELAMVIAVGGRDIPAADAWAHIGGYTVANDVSARGVQRAGMRDGVVIDTAEVARAKTFPTFAPLGPAVLVPDEVLGQPDQRLQTRVNGVVRQDCRTSEMHFDLAEILAFVSRSVELRPGDVVLTGTPGGVAAGGTGGFLRAGDTVEVSVEGIGVLTNAVVGG